MSSILKVDQIQLANGSTPTTIGLGLDVSGNVLQVVQQELTSFIALNGEGRLIQVSLTTKRANSKFLIQAQVNYQGVSTYTDHDLALAAGYRQGAASTSPSDYTAIHSSQFSRQNVTNLNAFYTTDTHPNGAAGDQFSMLPIPYSKIISPNVSSGVAMNFAIFGNTDGSYVFGRVSNNDFGYYQHITVTEIGG
jgi:hypothetical protein